MKLQQVIDFAVKQHDGQLRKFTGEPYINHPARVARTVSVYTDDFNTIAAAWLHDVIEDCDVKIETIGDLFGKQVQYYVANLTDFPLSYGNRERRKFLYRRQLALVEGRSGPIASTTLIKLCDHVDNMPSIKQHDPDFWRVYRHEIKRNLDELSIHPEFELHPIVKYIRNFLYT